MNSAATMLGSALKGAHELMLATMNGLTTEQWHHQAGGKTVPIAAHVGHVLVFEDGAINMLKGNHPLAMSMNTGFSELPPQQPPWDVWGRKVHADLAAVHAYGMAVTAASEAYVATLDDAALAKPLDLSMIGQGMQTVGFLLSGLVLNVHLHTGEVSCLKGLQGLQGYPI